MKKISALSTILLWTAFSLFAQAPAIDWQATFGGDGVDIPIIVRQTTDKGYIIGGPSNSGISGNKTGINYGYWDYWVIKLQPNGQEQWQKTFGGSSDDWLNHLQETADGGYILGGFSRSDISGDKTENGRGDYDYWVVKLNADGEILWQKTIGGAQSDDFDKLEQTADGGYILGGSSNSHISNEKTQDSWGGKDYWLVKLDAAGNIQWQQTLGGDQEDLLSTLHQTSDGGYLVGGVSASGISGNKTQDGAGMDDYWILKLDAAGQIQWQKDIGGSDHDWLRSFHETADGGYILGGTSYSGVSGDKTSESRGNCDYWMVKLDPGGNIQWQRTLGGHGEDNLSNLEVTHDGGYILSGYSESGISGEKTEPTLGFYDFWILKLDGNGLLQWQQSLGGKGFETWACIEQNSDDSYVLAGWSDSNISGEKEQNSFGDYDYWVVKLGAGLIPTEEPLNGRNTIQIYPNPTTGLVFIQTNRPGTIRLHNLLGQTLATQTVHDGDQIDLSRLPNGFYWLTEMETGFSHKILKGKEWI